MAPIDQQLRYAHDQTIETDSPPTSAQHRHVCCGVGVVLCGRCPDAGAADFLRGDSDGITYIDTIFLKPAQSENENVYFHELIHVIQWHLLGPDRFLLAYANGLECFGYRQSPLEAMAYDAESEFASSTLIFNAEKLVADKLGL